MRIRHLAAYLLCLLFSSTLFAQAYPAKLIRLVVPLPPGALTDIAMRRNCRRASASHWWSTTVPAATG